MCNVSKNCIDSILDAMKANNHYYIDYDKVIDYLSHGGGAAALTKLYSEAPE